MVGLMKLKLNTAQQSALKLVEDRLRIVGLDWIIITKNWLLDSVSLNFGSPNDDINLVGLMVGLIKLKLNLAQQRALKLIGDRLHLVGLN